MGVGDGAEAAYAAVRAYYEGEGEGVPVFVGVGWVVAGGGEGCPVFSVVAGDVGAVGAYGDPEFLGGVVGYGGSVAVGWGCTRRPRGVVVEKCGSSIGLVRVSVVAAHCDHNVWIVPGQCQRENAS